MQKVEEILKTLSSNAEDCDKISLKMWNLVMPYCIDCLTHIINFSITAGVVPKIWKMAKITPIPKTSKCSQPSDLRPINILPVASKILEKVVLGQILDHVNKYVLPDTQSGFRKLFSTNTALLKITSDIVGEMDSGRVTLLVMLDYSKAFDSMNHKLVLAKLHYNAFHPTVIKWFSSYL